MNVKGVESKKRFRVVGNLRNSAVGLQNETQLVSNEEDAMESQE